MGETKPATPIQITIDNALPLPDCHKYPLRPDVISEIKPIMQGYFSGRLVILGTRPCNSPIVPVQKPDGKVWRIVEHLRAINKIVTPRHLVVPNPPTLLPHVPVECNIF